jgi:hypothetical protein
MLIAGCAMTVIEGDCTITREIKAVYHCEPSGSLKHQRVAPPQGEP